MRNILFALVPFALATTSFASVSHAPVVQVHPSLVVEEEVPAVPPLELLPSVSPEVAQMTDYLEGLMRKWPHAAPSVPTVDFHEFAQDIATVVLREEPAWKFDHSRAKTAVLLLTLAYWEGSRFAAYVDEDLCSDPEWRHSPEGKRLMHLGGDCDGNGKGIAQAHSSFQIHKARWSDGEESTRENLGDRQFAIHIALRIARASLRRHATESNALGNLCDYSGEWEEPCPAAAVRLAWAKKQWKKHPFRSHSN